MSKLESYEHIGKFAQSVAKTDAVLEELNILTEQELADLNTSLDYVGANDPVAEWGSEIREGNITRATAEIFLMWHFRRVFGYDAVTLQVRDELPDLKDWWTDLTDVYSTVLQQAVEQIETNINNLGKLRDAGYNVGSLNWKAPHEYRSFTYRQRGFELDNKSDPNGSGTLTLKKSQRRNYRRTNPAPP